MADEESRVRVLVADDLASNRMLILAYLQAAGYGVGLAQDGIEAFEAFRREKFALVLMDVEMPEMDGCEATGKIRKFESGSGDTTIHDTARRTPVIAMTGYTEEDFNEQYPDADFDDFISKPISRIELLALLEKWITTRAKAPEPSTAKQYFDAQDAPMNLQKAIDEFEGDRDLLMRVLSGFLSDQENRIPILVRAFREKNYPVVRQAAHAIKGGAANLTAYSLAKAASTLEDSAESAEVEGDRDMIEKLEREFRRLEAYVESIQREPKGPHS